MPRGVYEIAGIDKDRPAPDNKQIPYIDHDGILDIDEQRTPG